MKPYSILVLIATLALAGCATPYQSSGYAGGFTHERLSESVFAVNFSGNGFTNDRRTRDLCMLRCAEVALEYRFKVFSIESERDAGGVDKVHMSSTTTTSANVNAYGNAAYVNATSTTTPNIAYVYKPGITIVIRCYESDPSGHTGRVFDARELQLQLREKYKIKG